MFVLFLVGFNSITTTSAHSYPTAFWRVITSIFPLFLHSLATSSLETWMEHNFGHKNCNCILLTPGMVNEFILVCMHQLSVLIIHNFISVISFCREVSVCTQWHLWKTHKLHMAYSGALLVFFIFSGNVWSILMVETGICISSPGKIILFWPGNHTISLFEFLYSCL